METTHHILVVDDHKEIRDLLAKFLAKHGMRVTVAADASEARRQLKAGAFDLIVLDIMMPGEDGLSLCKYLSETSSPPVILLTAVAEEMDRIIGLEVGADDYVTKPFNPRELLARIRAVLRRAQSMPPSRDAPAGERLKFGRFTFDSDRRELTDGRDIVTPLVLRRISAPFRIPAPAERGAHPRSAPRHHAGARGKPLRPQHRQSGQPPSPEDRGRPEGAEDYPDDLGRRL